MRVLVALGGNALLRRGQPMTAENQRANIAVAAEHLAPLATRHELVISHGNGPQIGLLALEGAAYEQVAPHPLDVLGAETQGMVGYLIEQELTNRLAPGRSLATLLTMIEVDPADPAFGDPRKPIGPLCTPEEAAALERERGWTFRPDGDRLRRVVASPAPRRVLELDAAARLLEAGCVVICAGGGGIPVVADPDGRLRGVEAVIDKDHASALLAYGLGADLLVMATDVPAACLDFGTEQQRAIRVADPDAMLAQHRDEFAQGSMLPKVVAGADFVHATGNTATIGQLSDIEGLVAGTAGTRMSSDVNGVICEPPPSP